jgi:4,5-dihydroxyphthalate decarboxylase
LEKVSMTLACGDYDRTRPLWDGSVRAEGLNLNVLLLPVEEIFFRMARYQEFDASEFSFSSYLISRSRGAPRFVGVPVFPSRKFRHADIYIRSGSGIRRPEDLKGARIGVPEYQITAAVWVRGILEEFYGVEARGVHWFTGGTEAPGREERLKLELPPSFKKTAIPGHTTLFDMLRKGELDAVLTARVPTPFLRWEEWISRLFSDSHEVEKASLPWFSREIESAFRIMAKDFWPYGVEKNRKAITTLIGCMKSQALLPEGFHVDVEDLFAPSTVSGFGV